MRKPYTAPKAVEVPRCPYCRGSGAVEASGQAVLLMSSLNEEKPEVYLVCQRCNGSGFDTVAAKRMLKADGHSGSTGKA